MTARDYIFYDFTLSLCNDCLRRVDAKILFRGSRVYMTKRCPEHGAQEDLISTDIEYYKKCRDFLKPGDLPKRFNTETLYGCPYDCGLCPDHEQHSCLSLLEITDRCNLSCPTCYTSSGPQVGRHRSLEEIERMLDAIVANEGNPDIVQISGGEPTLHPHFFEILDLAKSRPIRHLMVNTNGVRIAQDLDFAKRLARYQPNFEIYLQFDSFEKEALLRLRGADLREVRAQAIANLNQVRLSTTLVVTLQKGLNSHEIGKIIEFGLKQPCVRGVTFQPTQIAGRVEGFDPEKDRITLGEVRQGILEQSPVFAPEDLIPVPCNPDSLCMAYALKIDGEVVPLTRFVDPDDLLKGGGNTIVYEHNAELKAKLLRLFSTSHSPESATQEIKSLLCCLPRVAAPEGLGYENLFRIIIMQFLDARNFDVRSVKRSCVHIVDGQGRLIPFDTMNLFYREGLSSRLEELRLEGGRR
ncbi:MAG: radical SAM protein [Deltaproteobacteria bacterium]|nr:radical SAM protein [Deltaproteobacteria bacterium]